MEREKNTQADEFAAKARPGMPMLLLYLLLIAGSTAAFVWGCILASTGSTALGVVLIVAFSLIGFIIIPILMAGLKIVKPNEALVLTLFGKYIGTVRGEGYYYVNPFASAMVPASSKPLTLSTEKGQGSESMKLDMNQFKKRVSLKTMTLSNEKQKINDLLGNPIIIGIVVIWKVTNTYKALFNVENYHDFLSIQCDSALRNIIRLYPYDASDEEVAHEKSLRGSSQEIALKLKEEIQEKVQVAGLEIVEARITNLAYAPEIAAAMLQRQQASAIVDARQLIVEGAVGMVEMALEKLSQHEIVNLDEERKAAMVSNLLVVLCGNRDAQPIVNSGSLY